MVWVRGFVVAVRAATGLALATAESASAASVATLGAVTCADEQGNVDITVTADPAAAGPVLFTYFLNGTSADDPVEVAPGETAVIPLTDLDDDTYTVEVQTRVQAAEEDFETVFDGGFEVVCDPAPVGPYSNAKAELHDYCGNQVDVYATNRPIGGNTADLQPVTFRFTATVDGKTDTLAEFVLPDSTDDPYTHTALADLSPYFPDDETDDDVDSDEDGDDDGEPVAPEDPVSIALSVTANDTEIAATEHYGACPVLASSGTGPDSTSVSPVPNTGA